MTDNLINPSPRQEKMAVHACSGCGKAFAPTKDWQRFCSSGCRDNFHNRRKRGQIKSPQAFEESAAGENQQQRTAPTVAQSQKRIKSGTKLASVLAAFAAGQSLNRFEAYARLHDSVLNTTVSEIQKRGIRVSRCDEVVRGYRGSTVHCSRYWLEPEERERARAML